MSFDFSAYLGGIDPDQNYTITKLTGGFVNLTVRAIHTRTVASPAGVFQDGSIILKFAPPYVAGRGKSFPMTQFRQIIEARALSILQSSMVAEHEIDVPRLLKHDPENHVIVISDLGNMPNLSEMFSDLGGWTGFAGPPTFHPPRSLSSPANSGYFSRIGTKLGRFFALLHSPQTLRTVETDNIIKQNADLSQAWLDIATRPVGTQLAAFPDLLSQSEVDELYEVLEQDCTRPLSNSEKSFALGDCWTAAVLVDADVTNTNPDVGVIDWEFASIARGLHGDIAQLLAHLELFRIAAVHQRRDGHIQQIDTLTGALVSSYVSWSLEYSTPWTCQRAAFLKVFRSAFLAQAAEMVNCAFWKVWKCDDPACTSEDGSHTKVQHECVLVKKMVERAIWYLRQARNMSSSPGSSAIEDVPFQVHMDIEQWGLLALTDRV